MDRSGIPGDVAASDPKDTVPTGGPREVLASYVEYRDAQRLVDHLSDQGFDVSSVAIVAEGLRFVEQVTGRLDWKRAALNGLGSGALIGALIGFIFGIFNFFAPLTSALTLALFGLLFGALLGAIIGLVGYSLSGGDRDFTSVSGMQADKYAVTVDSTLASEARRLMDIMR